jgi:hypothetical protein
MNGGATFGESLLHKTSKICETDYRIHGEVHLISYVNYTLLWIKINETGTARQFW